MFIVGGLAELRTKLVDETCEQAVYDAVDRCWKANLQICNCLTKLLIKDQIKSEIMHLLHKIIDDGANCFVDNKRLMK